MLRIGKGERGKKSLSLSCLDQHTPSISIGGLKSQNLVTHGPEFLSLERLRQEVGYHVIGGHILHHNLALLHTVAGKKELNINVPGSLIKGSPVFHKSNSGHVVLVHNSVPLFQKKVAHPNNRGERISDSH